MTNDEIEIFGDTWSLVWVGSRSIDYYHSLLDSGAVHGFALARHRGFNFKKAEKLLTHAKLKALLVSDDIPRETVEVLDSLEMLCSGARHLDLTNFSQLRFLALEWSQKVCLPKRADSLQALRLTKYSPPSNTFSELSKFHQISSLAVIGGDLVSCDGIDVFNNLNELNLHHLRKLKTLRSLDKSRVTAVWIGNCPHLIDPLALGQARKLVSLKYYNNIEIASLKFLLRARQLQSFRFMGTNVVDGDMTPLVLMGEKFALRDVMFTNKRHFSHTWEVVQQQISCK